MNCYIHLLILQTNLTAPNARFNISSVSARSTFPFSLINVSTHFIFCVGLNSKCNLKGHKPHLPNQFYHLNQYHLLFYQEPGSPLTVGLFAWRCTFACCRAFAWRCTFVLLSGFYLALFTFVCCRASTLADAPPLAVGLLLGDALSLAVGLLLLALHFRLLSGFYLADALSLAVGLLLGDALSLAVGLFCLALHFRFCRRALTFAVGTALSLAVGVCTGSVLGHYRIFIPYKLIICQLI